MNNFNREAIETALAEQFPEWSVRVPNNDQNIVMQRDDGASFYLHGEWSGKRFEVSGEYPRSLSGGYHGARDWRAIDYNASEPRISVSQTREPKAIAKDIARRFLPEYLDIYAKCLEKKAETQAYEDARGATFARRKAAAPADARESRDHGLSWHRTTGGYGSLQAHNDSVSFEIRSVPTDTAVAILELLREGVTNG